MQICKDFVCWLAVWHLYFNSIDLVFLQNRIFLRFENGLNHFYSGHNKDIQETAGEIILALGRKQSEAFYSPGSQTWWWRGGPGWETTGPKRSGTPGRTCSDRNALSRALILHCVDTIGHFVLSNDIGCYTCWPPRRAPPSSSSGRLGSGCQTLGLTRAGSSRGSEAEGTRGRAQVFDRAVQHVGERCWLTW